MAGCAVLQKWHWQILEESSASVSACSLVRYCCPPCSVTLPLFSSSLFHCSSLFSPSLSHPLCVYSSVLISLLVFESFFSVWFLFLVAFIFPIVFFFKIVIAYVCSSSLPFFSAFLFLFFSFQPEYSYYCAQFYTQFILLCLFLSGGRSVLSIQSLQSVLIYLTSWLLLDLD